MDISLSRYYKILAQYLAQQKARFALLVFLLLSSIGLQILNPQIVRYFLDSVSSGVSINQLVAAAGLYLVAALLQQAFGVSATYAGETVAWTATNALREDLMDHALSLDMRYHNQKSPGELIERIETDATQFSNFFSQLVIRVAGNLLLILGIIVALFLVDWRLGIAFAIFVFVALLALNSVRGLAIPYRKAERDAETELFGFLEERLAGTEDIRACGAVDFVLCRLYQLQTVILGRARKASLMNLGIGATGGLMLMVGFGVAFVLGYHLVKAGAITLGSAYVVYHYTNLLSRPVRELTQQVESLQSIGAVVERVDELLRERREINDGPGAVIAESDALALQFDGVSFHYAQDKPVLQGVSFYLAKGKVLGLLGRTGGGKTTLARLIFRLYDPQAGAIKLDGIDIRQFALAQLRSRVAYVTQDVQLFQATVRENITLFNKSVSDSQIMEVIEALALGSWFSSLPEGLDTRLQSGGRSLSAGEAQLLALTRVFLRNPGLVILDEASSRLDPATEQLLERAIDRLLAGRTAIVIAHRLGTVHRCDDICILENGAVAELGDRKALLVDKSSRFFGLHHTGLEELLA